MINTKVLVAVLAVVACASADGTTKIHRKRALRHRARVSAAAATNDLTEDVAFWTRSLQASLPPVPPPTEGVTPIPSPTGSGVVSGPPVTAASPIPSPTGSGVVSGPPVTAASPIPSPTGSGAVSGPPVTAASPIPSPTGSGVVSGPPVASPIPSPTGSGVVSGPPVASPIPSPTGSGDVSGPPATLFPTPGSSVAVSAPKASEPPVSSDLPVAQDDSETVNAADGVSFIDVLVNDTSSTDQTLTVKSITSNASNGDCSIGLDLLTVVYVPNEGFTGTDSCEYEACDLVPNCVTATVTITVN